MKSYTMYCYSEYEYQFKESPIIEYCAFCGEALRSGYDVIYWSGLYFCNMEDFIEYIGCNPDLTDGMDITELYDYKEVTLKLY